MTTRSGASAKARARRARRLPVAIAAAVALVVVGTSFPVAQILTQRRELAGAEATLARIQEQNRTLGTQKGELEDNAALGQIARQRYQLVKPGQTLIQVVAPAGQATGPSDGTSGGDPATQPLVAPGQAPDVTLQPGLLPSTGPASSSTRSTGGRIRSTSPSGFLSRVERTLEFWN